METKTCAYCGDEFLPYKNTQKYCSKACAEADKKKFTRVCPVCGKEFLADYASRKFCSDVCYHTFNRVKEFLYTNMDNHAISLIRYGQNNPFSKPTALWVQYKEIMREKEND